MIVFTQNPRESPVFEILGSVFFSKFLNYITSENISKEKPNGSKLLRSLRANSGTSELDYLYYGRKSKATQSGLNERTFEWDCSLTEMYSANDVRFVDDLRRWPVKTCGIQVVFCKISVLHELEEMHAVRTHNL